MSVISHQASQSLTFKIASEQWEFEQIYKLNHRTFAEEISRYAPHPSQVLVDRFDHENTYIICLRGNQFLGMVAIRGQRPFSLDEKLAALDKYLPAGCSVCEIRLLAVDRQYRKRQIFPGLVKALAQYCEDQAYNLAVISGIVKEKKLYEQLGFVPFGPRVGTPEALFQPMYITRETFEKRRT